MRRIWGRWGWGCLKAEEPSSPEPRGHLRFCWNGGIQAGVQGWGSEIWKPWLREAVLGVWWPGLLLVGALVSWARLRAGGWKGGHSLSLGRSPGSGPLLQHPLSRWPREERGRLGGSISDPSSFIPVPATLPHLSPTSQSAISHLLYTHCVHRTRKCSLTVLTLIVTVFPLPLTADTQTPQPLVDLGAQKPLLKAGI